MDEDLRLAASGDADAFARFYDATVHRAHLLARLLTDTPVAAARATEQAYRDAWTLAGDRPTSSLSPQAWLAGLVQRRALQ